MRLLPTGVEEVPERADVLVFGTELRHLLAELGNMRELQLIQTLIAAVEWLFSLVPTGVLLCNASGVHDAPVAEWVIAAVLIMERRVEVLRGPTAGRMVDER